MRLKQNRLKAVFHKMAVSQKDSEGSSYVEYGAAAKFLAEGWPGGGKLQAEMYGARLPNIRNLRLEGAYTETQMGGKLCYLFRNGMAVSVGDGICLFVPSTSDPDYRITAIYPYRFLTLEVEKI